MALPDCAAADEEAPSSLCSPEDCCEGWLVSECDSWLGCPSYFIFKSHKMFKKVGEEGLSVRSAFEKDLDKQKSN